MVVLIGWVMFRAETLSGAITYVKHMFGLADENRALMHWMLFLSYEEIAVFAIALLCSYPFFRNMIHAPEEGESDSQFAQRQKVYFTIPVNVWLLVLFVLAVTRIATSTYNPFIYFRF